MNCARSLATRSLRPCFLTPTARTAPSRGLQTRAHSTPTIPITTPATPAVPATPAATPATPATTPAASATTPAAPVTTPAAPASPTAPTAVAPTAAPPPPPAAPASPTAPTAVAPTAAPPPPPPPPPATASTTTTSAAAAAAAAAGRDAWLRTIELMPFQTYQLALDVIRRDRQEKLTDIQLQQDRLNKIVKFGKTGKGDRRLLSMARRLEYLHIQSEINLPRTKYNFDRGKFSLQRPVYRFLLNRKWREYRRPVLMQRLTQMHVVPDLLPHIDPVVDVQVRFQGKSVPPGVFLDSRRTEGKPTFKIIPFAPGEFLCTAAVVDSDVPNIDQDKFDYRLHWLVANVKISPTQTQAVGDWARTPDTLVDWLPPHVQKGAPYHRYSLIVFKQLHGAMDVSGLANKTKRDGFNLRRFQTMHALEPVGAFMWRAQWDEHTKDLMQRHRLPGWDSMLVRKKAV